MKKKTTPLLKRIELAAAKTAIHEHIKNCGSRTAAAKALGITTETLRQKLAAR